MYIFYVRDFFQELLEKNIYILPLFIPWIILGIILLIKRTPKKSFVGKFHKVVGVILVVAFLFPIVGYMVSTFSVTSQRNFKSYEHFVSTKPGEDYDFLQTFPDGAKNAKYYCYQSFLDSGTVVCLLLEFKDDVHAKEYCSERMALCEEKYSNKEENSNNIFYINNSGLDIKNANEEDLIYYLSKISDSSIDHYNILLYYEQTYESDSRWILLCEETNEVIEIIADYTSW